MDLRPAQAIALKEMADIGGAFCPLGVGFGKTLISLLAPTVLGAKRPLLILPAALVDKTHRELEPLSKHWKIQRNIHIISYEMLGRVQAANMLENLRPDLILADESHKIKNKRAGVTRRVSRHMSKFPDTKFVALSGTVMRHSIRDFAHMLKWCLKSGAPVPLSEGELEEWSNALDEGVNPLQRWSPGPIISLSSEYKPFSPLERSEELPAARRAFQSRLIETPGVISSKEASVDASIYIQAIEYKVNDATEQNFKKLRSEWETPDGWALTQAVDVWRHARELALGFHGVWDPRPPQEWLNSRRDWAKYVREVLSKSRTMDTPLQVSNACSSGELPDHYLRAWMDVKDTFKIAPKAQWHDDSAMAATMAWMKKGPGIVWCSHVFFAEALSMITGAPYFGAGGVDKLGRAIEFASAKECIIASVGSNSTGRNLQKWDRNLITSVPTNAITWEQMVGRTHREGQKSDQVEVDMLVGCFEHFDSFQKALSNAQSLLDTLGQDQRILIADKVLPTESEIKNKIGWRWLKNAEIGKLTETE